MSQTADLPHFFAKESVSILGPLEIFLIVLTAFLAAFGAGLGKQASELLCQWLKKKKQNSDKLNVE